MKLTEYPTSVLEASLHPCAGHGNKFMQGRWLRELSQVGQVVILQRCRGSIYGDEDLIYDYKNTGVSAMTTNN